MTLPRSPEEGDDRMTESFRHGNGSAAVCVAPTYPEWAVTEDGDWVWVRLDLADRAHKVASAALDCDFARAQLDRHGIEFMWLDRKDVDWSDEWMLREVTADADEAVAYVRFEVVDGEPLTDEEYDRIDGHA